MLIMKNNKYKYLEVEWTVLDNIPKSVFIYNHEKLTHRAEQCQDVYPKSVEQQLGHIVHPSPLQQWI